ncbi:MAG: hypothetical protein AB8B50_10795 [Pirellulaceae bacterium]
MLEAKIGSDYPAEVLWSRSRPAALCGHARGPEDEQVVDFDSVTLFNPGQEQAGWQSVPHAKRLASFGRRSLATAARRALATA